MLHTLTVVACICKTNARADSQRLLLLEPLFYGGSHSSLLGFSIGIP